MEIPYTVTARSDTGLWNAKIGIWLFLASEVMLFGGLFSSYVFLRIGADFVWPIQELKIMPGLLNTANLIISSVTVVFAWAALKMRNYRRYQVCMAITLFCAVIFMGIKAYEYYGKFTHYGVKFKDGMTVEGHMMDDKIHFGETTALTVDFEEFEAGYFLKYRVPEDGPIPRVRAADGKEGELGSAFIADRIEEAQKKAKEEVDKAAAAAGLTKDSKDWKKFVKNWELYMTGGERLEIVGEPLEFKIKKTAFTGYTANDVIFKDLTKIEGKLISDDIIFGVDRIDVREMKDPMKDPENSTLFTLQGVPFKEGDHAYPAWQGSDWKEAFIRHRASEMADFVTEHPEMTPEDIAKNGEFGRYGLRLATIEKGSHDYPTLAIPRDSVRYYSSFGPSYNTYYSIYFLMTGLHGLHVIGGAIVLGYMLFFNRWVYDKNPEHLANRVETAGLFWHFVDLVWIFLFPVFYLL